MAQVALSTSPRCGRLGLRIAGVQTLVTLLAGAALSLTASPETVLWALVGGGIGTVGTLIMSVAVVLIRADASPQRMLLAFYAGEFLKLLWIAIAFAAVFILFEPDALMQFACFMLSLLVFWAVLLSRTLRGEG